MKRPCGLALLLLAGLAARAALMPLPDPFAADLTSYWLPWMRYGATHGLMQLYQHGQPAVNYPPLYVSLLVGLGKVYGVLVPSFAYTPLQSVLVKLPAVAADLTIAVLLYVAAASSVRGERMPLLAAALWALNPAAIYVSSYWGQVDAIHTLWMVAALLAALRRRPGWSGLWLGLALLTKLQAVVLAPLLLLIAWREGPRVAGRGVVATVATLAVGLAPFWAAQALGPVLAAYTGAVGFYPALSMNAYNPWYLVHVLSRRLLGQPLPDTLRVLGPLTLRHVGLGLLAAYAAVILRRRSEDWATAFFAAGLLVFGFFMLATEMHERYVLPSLALLALPAVQLGRRGIAAYALLSLTTFLCLLRVFPFGPGIYGLMETVPGSRVVLAVANIAVFVLWTALYLHRPASPAAPLPAP